MRPTFELRYCDGKPCEESKTASSFKKICEPAELVMEARKIFDSSDTLLIEAWLYDHYMFAIDRGAIEKSLIHA